MAVFTKRIRPYATGRLDGPPVNAWINRDAALIPDGGATYATAEFSESTLRHQDFLCRSSIPRDAVITSIRAVTICRGIALEPAADLRLFTYSLTSPAGDQVRTDNIFFSPMLHPSGAFELTSGLMAGSKLPEVNAKPGLLRDFTLRMSANIRAPGAMGPGNELLIDSFYLDVTYEADASDEVDIYPTRPGTIADPGDWAAWRDLDKAIVPDGGATYGYSQLRPGTQGNTGRFLIESSIPTSAMIEESELFITAAADLVDSSSLPTRIYGFVLEDGELVSAQSLAISVSSESFEELSVVVEGPARPFIRETPGLLRRVGVVLSVGRSSSSALAVERLLIDSFFLRVRYTYEPEQLEVDLPAAPALTAELWMRAYLEADLETQAQLAATLHGVLGLEAELPVEPHLAAEVLRLAFLEADLGTQAQLTATLTRAQLVEALLGADLQLTAELRRVLPPLRGPRFTIAPVGHRLRIS